MLLNDYFLILNSFNSYVVKLSKQNGKPTPVRVFLLLTSITYVGNRMFALLSIGKIPSTSRLYLFHCLSNKNIERYLKENNNNLHTFQWSSVSILPKLIVIHIAIFIST